MEVSNSVVLVTGAGRGWGRSVAIAFAKAGSKVIIVSRTEKELFETAQLIRNDGGIVEVIAADLGTPDGVQKTYDFVIEKYGCLDVLVNTAAILRFKEFIDHTEEDIYLLTNVNLLSYMLLCRKFLPGLIEQKKGCIINISSNAGEWAFEKETVYAATKFAIEGFSKSLALELSKHNISVNTITPGGIKAGVRMKPTNMLESELASLDPAVRDKYTDSLDYCEAFIYLAKQSGAEITGERVLAYELSQSIRDEGWDTEYQHLEQVRPDWK